MTKFKGFTKEHVGKKVTDLIHGNGIIEGFRSGAAYPVIARFGRFCRTFTSEGLLYEGLKTRCLYFGHNIKITVTGEEVPEPVLICPVCGVVHEACQDQDKLWSFDCKVTCPFYLADFYAKEHTVSAMKALIKAMGK